MSATGRKRSAPGAQQTVRDPRDFYNTPAWAVRAILPFLPTGGVILDPGCGSGAIMKVLLETIYDSEDRVVGIELDETLAKSAYEATEGDVMNRDFLKETFGGDSFDLVIGNPPYSLAMEFVEHSLDLACGRGGTVAMLLRLPWAASQSRAEFHRARPADIYVLPKRPSFTPDGKTDATDYAWFVWTPSGGGRWRVLDVEVKP
jgi:SAM-dependent methyltransferase